MTKYLLLLFILAAISCSQQPDPLFKLLPPEQTGISFQNDVMEDEYLNILSNEYLYNGAGVGVGDFNKDGLQDIFFSGSQVTNRLYLNKGTFHFEDVTIESHIAGRDRWSTGVAVVDINNDGWPDIYVCASNHLDPEMRRNQLYIHEGLNENGIPVFTEQARKFGVDDAGFSTHAAFFDYDNDDDLDLYVLTNYLDTSTPNTYRAKITDGSAESNDRLYRNNGNGTFTNVTLAAGITYEGYGLGISIIDLNHDGWRDMYITNDYLTNDLMYINQQDGTFTNEIAHYLKHQTHSAMGHDIADVNNDGLPDIFTLDMLPEDHEGMTKMHGVTRFEYEALNDSFGYQPQFKRNMLQINNGSDANGNHTFSEIGLMAGIYATEWSWSPLLADFDNDGFRDLFVSNGYPRDVTDLDYAVTGMSRGRGMSNEETMALIPVRSMSNYIFQNNKDLTFTNKTKDWGLDKPSFANGAAYVDLDNDGDLDLLTSNYNEPAMVYENTLYGHGKEKTNHYLSIRLNAEYFRMLGAKVYVFAQGEKVQYADHSTFRGYRSTVDPVVHFGLGATQEVDSLIVVWPDGKRQTLLHPRADQQVVIDYRPEETLGHGPLLPVADSSTYHSRKLRQIMD
ncbi:MAG: CRTAC1 family protein [Cyclobacteriaceae bacterium]|nr:CRTAC1 family protein [Cyclobacteriaceae bacterium]